MGVVWYPIMGVDLYVSPKVGKKVVILVVNAVTPLYTMMNRRYVGGEHVFHYNGNKRLNEESKHCDMNYKEKKSLSCLCAVNKTRKLIKSFFFHGE